MKHSGLHYTLSGPTFLSACPPQSCLPAASGSQHLASWPPSAQLAPAPGAPERMYACGGGLLAAQKLPREITPVNLEELRRVKQALVELESKAENLR